MKRCAGCESELSDAVERAAGVCSACVAMAEQQRQARERGLEMGTPTIRKHPGYPAGVAPGWEPEQER